MSRLLCLLALLASIFADGADSDSGDSDSGGSDSGGSSVLGSSGDDGSDSGSDSSGRGRGRQARNAMLVRPDGTPDPGSLGQDDYRDIPMN